MSNFALTCGSTVDLTEDMLKQRNIEYLSFTYYLDGVEHADDMGKTMPLKDFYNAMANGADTKTAQINVDQYLTFFEKFLAEGKDILYVSLSSGLSGTYGSAQIAVEELKEKYPERKIYIVDSLGASSGYGLIMMTLADMRDEGKSIDEVYAFAEENRLNVHHWFFSTDLTFYIKGGRVSKVSGWFGTVLKICPLLHMDYQGKLIPMQKVRGKNKVKEEIVERMIEHARGGFEYNDRCYICHSNCEEDAIDVKTIIKEKFKNIKGDIEIFNIGTVIGSHTGPGTVALFFWGDKRVD